MSSWKTVHTQESSGDEPKFIPRCVPRWLNQVHRRGLHHHYTERFTCLSSPYFLNTAERVFIP